MAGRNGGGAILAGGFGINWVVGAVNRRGQIDPTFGNGGWTVLPFHGEATAIVQEPSGRIVIGGDNFGGGCCRVNWAAALSPRGHLDREFGKHGRTKLRAPSSEAGIRALTRKPNGDILAAVGYGNNGCWGVALDMLTASGQPVPRFAQRTDRFWQRLGFNAFVGDVYTDGQGFTLVGTGQRPCFGGSLSSAPSATGLIMRFRTNGEPIGKAVRFPSRMFGTVRAFHAGNDTFVVMSPYADQTRLTLTARRRDGSIDPRFGSRGLEGMARADASGYSSGVVTLAPSGQFASELRRWRSSRRWSQLELALRAGTTQRHLSYIEQGRSRPGRTMVVRLAESLGLSLRERNALLHAAGYAPIFPESRLDDEALRPVRDALERILEGHLPYPAVVVRGYGELVAANTAVGLLTADAPPELLEPPINVLRLSVHPNAMGSRVENLAEWGRHIVESLRARALQSPDPQLDAFAAELEGYLPAIPPGSSHLGFAVPLRLRTDEGELRLITTLTSFATAVDITLAELQLEAFLPADADSARILHERAQRDPFGAEASLPPELLVGRHNQNSVTGHP